MVADASVAVFLLLTGLCVGAIKYDNVEEGLVAMEKQAEKDVVKNTRLYLHLINAFNQVNHSTQCAQLCRLTPDCKSYQYRQEDQLCEMNNATLKEYPSDYKRVHGWSHYRRNAIAFFGIWNPCNKGGDPCRNGGICTPLLLKTPQTVPNHCRPVCVCPVGYQGDNCETDVRREEEACYAQLSTDLEITAFSTHVACSVENALLNSIGWGAGWCAEGNNLAQWLQVDLGTMTRIAGVITQGRVQVEQWVTSYSLTLSTDGVIWEAYSDQGQEKVFAGNSDSNTVVQHLFDAPAAARFVRFHPLTWHGWISMRVAVLRCTTGWEQHGSSFFKITDSRKRYQKARAVCAKEGATLAVIKDQETHDFIISLKNMQLTDVNLFIGLNDIESEGNFMWEDGSPIGGFDKWFDGQPSNKRNQDCAVMVSGSHSHPNMWSDTSCATARRYICQKRTYRWFPVKAIESSGSPWADGVTYDADRTLDDNPGTYWHSAGLDQHFNNWYIIYDMRVNRTLSNISLTNYRDTVHDVKAFILQTSVSCRPFIWTDVLTVTDVAAGGSKAQTFGGFSERSRYWRLLITETHSGWPPFLVEVKFPEVPAVSGFQTCLTIATENGGEVRSLLYPEPTSYSCEALLTVGSQQVLEFTFRSTFSVEHHPDCRFDYVELSDFVGDKWKSLGKFCGRSRPQRTVRSTGNAVKVVFHADEAIPSLFSVAWQPKHAIPNNDTSLSEVMCSRLTVPTNGNVTTELTDSYRAEAKFTCHEGFRLRGADSLSCQADGRWSNRVPTCTHCHTPLGMYSRAIPNSAITASSIYNVNHPAHYGRLNRIHGHYDWCAAKKEVDQWLQVDLGVAAVSGVTTQGRHHYNQWVTSYKLLFSWDGNSWTSYKNNNNSDMVFAGNTNRLTHVTNHLDPPVITKHVRFVVQSWFANICMRVEVLGCRNIGPVLLETAPTMPFLGQLSRSLQVGDVIKIYGVFKSGARSESINLKHDSSNHHIALHISPRFSGDNDGFVALNSMSYGRWAQQISLRSNFPFTRGAYFWITIDVTADSYRVLVNGNFFAEFEHRISLERVTHVDMGSNQMQVSFVYVGKSSNDAESASPSSRVRLVGGSGPHEGCVEVRPVDSYDWGTVCDDHFDIKDAAAVCRTLGYSGAYQAHRGAHFGQGTGPVYMDNLRCDGTESSMFDCPYLGWGINNCGHDEDAGVVCLTNCYEPLGMENGKIPDGSITASSVSNIHYAHYARLHSLDGTAAWCADMPKLAAGQWLQVDLGAAHMVHGVITQGRATYDQWVTSYKLQYSLDGSLWKNYKDIDGSDQVFTGNTDRTTPVTNILRSPVAARYIRFVVQTWYGHICMRAEVLGCMKVGCLDPLGMESGDIPDGKITASSQHSSNHHPYYGRLNSLVGKAAWISRINAAGQWLQIDLGGAHMVHGVITQGRGTCCDQWVRSYKLQYSWTGTSWTYYTDTDGADKIFTGNSDRHTAITHILRPPVAARYVRFVAQTFRSHISMRVELLGCTDVGCNVPLGMQSRHVLDESITASSVHPHCTELWNRLHSQGARFWCAEPEIAGEWLQIDLGLATVAGVVTQGRSGARQWVTSYRLKFSRDGDSWTTYNDTDGTEKVFAGNKDDTFLVTHILHSPVTTRYIRFVVQTWIKHISMAVEVLGCYNVT